MSTSTKSFAQLGFPMNTEQYLPLAAVLFSITKIKGWVKKYTKWIVLIILRKMGKIESKSGQNHKFGICRLYL